MPWRAGPADDHQGPVVISATRLAMHRHRDRPGAMLAGMRLRAGWYAMPGAVGLSLWGSLDASGSISVWTDEASLRRFVGLPAHLAIMRAYADRGRVTSHTWTAERFDLEQAHREASSRW